MRPCDLHSSLLPLNLTSCYSSTCLPLTTVTPLLILSDAGRAPASGPLHCCTLGLECSSPRYPHGQVLFFLWIFAQMLLLSEAHPDHCIPSCSSCLFSPILLIHLHYFNFYKALADLLNTSITLFVMSAFSPTRKRAH